MEVKQNQLFKHLFPLGKVINDQDRNYGMSFLREFGGGGGLKTVRT